MARVKKTIVIRAPLKEVYDYIDDPKNAPEWIGDVIEVQNIKGAGAQRRFDWTFKVAGIRLKGENRYTQDIPGKRIVVEGRSWIGPESTWTFNFEQRRDDTVLNLDIDYTVPVPVIGKLAEKALLKRNERQTDQNLRKLKKILDAW